MIQYEEYKLGIVPEGEPPIARGKICWFGEQEIGRDCINCLPLFQQSHLTDDLLLSLKEELKKALEKKGFIFFDICYYRYKLHRNGSLKEFGINYHYIR